MLHRLPFPSGSRMPLYTTLLILLISLSHCQKQEIAGAYGDELIGLPAGTFDIQMAGQTEKVTISEGKITDF